MRGTLKVDGCTRRLVLLNVTAAPIFPAVKYSLRNFSGLGPITKSPYAGYGPEVDKMWDYIANGGEDYGARLS